MLLFALIGVAGAWVANDYCSGAAVASDGLNTGTNYNALAWSQTSSIETADVFYKYTASTTGWATFTAYAGFYIQSVVFWGTTCDKLVPPASYLPGSASGAGTASFTWPIFSGVPYYISIGSQSGSGTGTFTFVINTSTSIPIPGDSCTSPLGFVAGNSFGDNTQASIQDWYYRDDSDGGDLFWLYNATCTGIANVTVSASTTTIVESYYVSDCSHIVGTDNRMPYDHGSNPTVVFPVWNLSTYFISTAGYTTYDLGTMTLQVTCTDVSRPANDQCNGATAVFDGVQFTTSTVNAATNLNPNIFSYTPSQEVWLHYTATCNGTAVVALNGSTHIGAFKGTCANSYPVAGESTSNFTFAVQSGDQVWIALGDGTDETISGTVTCTPVLRPTNTWCQNAVHLLDGPSTASSVNAVTDPKTMFSESGLSGGCDSIYATLFFWYNASCSGLISLTTNSSTSETMAFVLYADNTCAANYPPVYCNNYLSSGNVVWNTQVGQAYTFAIGYASSSPCQGNLDISIVCTPESNAPTGVTPSFAPTAPTAASSAPTAPTSRAPTAPTTAPTHFPTMAPNNNTGTPTKTPTGAPTNAPSGTGSGTPTKTPTSAPNSGGSGAPTKAPSTANSTNSSAPTKATTASGAAFAGFGIATFFGLLLL